MSKLDILLILDFASWRLKIPTFKSVHNKDYTCVSTKQN